MSEARVEVRDAIEKVQRALKIARTMLATTHQHMEKMEQTIREFMAELEKLAREMMEVAEQ